MNRRPDEPQSQSGHGGKEKKKSLTLTGIKAQLSNLEPAHYTD